MYGGIGKWSVQEEGARFVFWLLDGRQFTLATSAVSYCNQVCLFFSSVPMLVSPTRGVSVLLFLHLFADVVSQACVALNWGCGMF